MDTLERVLENHTLQSALETTTFDTRGEKETRAAHLSLGQSQVGYDQGGRRAILHAARAIYPCAQGYNSHIHARFDKRPFERMARFKGQARARALSNPRRTHTRIPRSFREREKHARAHRPRQPRLGLAAKPKPSPKNGHESLSLSLSRSRSLDFSISRSLDLSLSRERERRMLCV